MASDRIIGRHLLQVGWLYAALLASWFGGWTYAMGKTGWCVVSVVVALACGFMVVRKVLQVGQRVRYIMDATMNGDFSYKFKTENVGRYERDTNLMLNKMVEHMETLTTEIRQKESFLEHIISLSGTGMVVADSMGNVRLHNEAALRLLERPALTHICQISRQAFSGLSIEKSDAVLNGNKIQIYTINDMRSPIQSAEVESWEKLTRVLTHEIMNSLTPIDSIAKTVKGRAGDEEMREALDTISSSSRSLMTFVKNFRQFSVLPEIEMRVVYLRPLLEKCVRMSQTYVGDGGIDISLSCFPPDVMIYTDEALLSRVVINILKNAVEAMPVNISIEACLSADESVEIRISNDGEPISEDDAEHIFTPFFTTRPSGSGIGLSLSRRIVSHLGGTLTLATRPQTCFLVRI